MLEKYHPTPDDLRPAHPELESMNEEFLSDVENKMDAPYTRQEQKAQQQAAKDRERITLDSRPANPEPFEDTLRKMEALMGKEVTEAQWSKLDSNSRDLLKQVRDIYQDIGNRTRDAKNIVSARLAADARSAFAKLEEKFLEYSEGNGGPEPFVDALNEVYLELHEIQAMLSTPNT